MHNNSFKRTAVCLALTMALAACGKSPEPRQTADANAAASVATIGIRGTAFAAVDAENKPAEIVEQQARRMEQALDKSRIRESAVSPPAVPALRQQGQLALVKSARDMQPAQQLVSSVASYTDTGHKFVRTARASFSVADVYKSALAIEDAVAGQSGFVTANQISSSVQRTQRYAKGDGTLTELTEYVVHGTLTVRVPSDKTQAFLRAIAAEIEFLDQRGFEAHDVQFDMLRQHLAFIRNQETQEELGQITREGGKLPQKAEVVTARNDTKAARDEAKVVQKELEDRIAYSTIDLAITQPVKVRQAEVIDSNAMFRANGPGFFARALDALEAGWSRTLEFLLAMIGAWPALLALAAIALIVRGVLRAGWLRKARNDD
jgi:hypothetical protein